jgi:hypothetical protein
MELGTQLPQMRAHIPTASQIPLHCRQQGGLTVCGCSLFGPRSLQSNKIGDAGAQRIGEALKINKALTTFENAPAPPQVQNELALLSARGRLTVCGCSLFDPRSLRDNNIKDEDAQHIGEAVKIN